jgi:hypothetical protein
MGEVCSWGHGDHDAHPGEVRGGQEQAARHRVLADRGGRSSSVMTATGRRRANGVVLGLFEVKGVVQVQGEREGRAESTGHDGVLSRPGTCPGVLWASWASLGACGLGSVDVVSVRGVHGQHQQC